MAKGDVLYNVVQKVGKNAYKIDLSRDVQIFATFNVRDITPYIEDEDEHNEDLTENTP